MALSACSDLDVNRTSAFDDRRPGETRTGLFKPGNVAGLAYDSSGTSGVTDNEGRFDCITDQPVSFSIGAVDLGEAVCTGLVHPASLTTSGSLSDPVSINMTRFLLLLDDDRQPQNGIVIPAAIRTLADSWPAIDFAAADFDAELIQVLSDIASTGGAGAAAVPAATDAFAFLDSSLSCAYSGLFVNSFFAGAFTAPTEVALLVYREPGTATDLFSIRIRRNHSQSQMYLEAQGTSELATLPSLVMSDSVGAGSINASYLTPDVVGGSFRNAIAQQTVDRSGAFEALRIGDEQGEYRFVGTFERPGETATPVVFGVLTFVLDGDSITGEAFDMTVGVSGTLTGRRLPGSADVEFTSGFSGEPGTGTLRFDEAGNIVGFEGNWPGTRNASSDAVACRMI